MLERILGNLKTSIAGVATAIVTIVAVFGYNLNAEIVATFLTVVVVILGLLAKD